MVADTVVVREKEVAEPVLFDSANLDEVMVEKIRPFIYHIDEQDFYLIRDFFARLSKINPDQAVLLAEKIARGLAVKLGFQPGESINPVVLMRTIGALYREK